MRKGGGGFVAQIAGLKCQLTGGGVWLRRRMSVSSCPIGLDKVHCGNCYFWRNGRCDYDAIMREHSSKEATEGAPEGTTSSP